jgi:hypothetical protein
MLQVSRDKGVVWLQNGRKITLSKIGAVHMNGGMMRFLVTDSNIKTK